MRNLLYRHRPRVGYRALFVIVQKLNRIFDGDDVVRLMLVYAIDIAARVELFPNPWDRLATRRRCGFRRA